MPPPDEAHHAVLADGFDCAGGETAFAPDARLLALESEMHLSTLSLQPASAALRRTTSRAGQLFGFRLLHRSSRARDARAAWPRAGVARPSAFAGAADAAVLPGDDDAAHALRAFHRVGDVTPSLGGNCGPRFRPRCGHRRHAIARSDARRGGRLCAGCGRVQDWRRRWRPSSGRCR